MPLRLVEIYLPDGADGVRPVLEEHALLDRWTVQLAEGGQLVQVVLDTSETEAFVDDVEDALSGQDFRIVLLAVEATLPRPEADADDPAEAETSGPTDGDGEEDDRTSHIGREELYADASEAVDVAWVHYTLVALSTIVAAGGLLQDSVAVIVGAMVIAPLLGPNSALALGITLGDTTLVRRALRVNIAGLVLALGLSIGIGLLFDVSPELPELARRTRTNLGDLALALAAGVAGGLSFTRGVSSRMIGVMVAVALLPALVAGGMLVGAGRLTLAYGALLLLLTNIVSINLAAVVTFLAQGIRPSRWYEAQQARHATRVALALGVALLVLLVVAILLAPEPGLPGTG